LNEGYNRDNFYLFNKDRLLVEVKDEKYIIPNREGLEDLNIQINHIQCLGSYDGVNCYCGEIEEIKDNSYEFIDLRTYSKQVNHDDFLLSAKAILLLNHVRENQKCGKCGTQMIMKSSGNDRAMICMNCDNMVWPKTAPAIIVAVTKGEKLLLAHNKMFPEGMYSVVAGFVELGETFEQCVKREVYEEIGIKIHNIKYFGSQPWPFPNSMMIGFTAEHLEGEIKVDNDEIVDAKWFSKEEIPGKYRKSISISSELIGWFLNR
jgi:NAD+ diphosphatase